MVSFPTQARPLTASDIQGEWVSDAGPRPTGVSIRQCDDRGRCPIDTFHLGKSCLRSGSVTLTENSDWQDIVLNSNDPNETPCALRLSKDGEQLSLQRVDQGRFSCKMQMCEPLADGEKRTYRRLSHENFIGIPGWGVGDCYETESKSIRTLCSDRTLYDLLDHVRDIPMVATGVDWFFDRPLFEKCDSGDNIRDCLERGYQGKVAALKEESAKLWMSYGVDGGPADAKKQSDKLKGVFKRHFKNRFVSGETYESEDIFEFVPITEVAAYFKIALYFMNGHESSLSGVAEFKNVGGFVFQDDMDSGPEQCLLTVVLNRDMVGFNDPNGNCRKVCGARGYFSGDEFRLKQRRTIKYMPIILHSKEYIKAIATYEKRHPKQP